MKFKCVILCPYIRDECNGDILTGSGVLKISENITTDLPIDFNHLEEKAELKNVKLINTEILSTSQEWGDKIAKKGSLIGTIESTNDQVDECIREGRIKGVSIHTRFNPDKSDVCTCEIEENPEDKTFNNTENKECLNPRYLSLIGGDKIPCNGFSIKIIEEDNMTNEEDKKDKENIETDVEKAELSEEKIAELVGNAVAEGMKPLVEAISNLNVEKADDEEKSDDQESEEETPAETSDVTEDSKDKVDIKKAKPKIKKDIFGLNVVKI